MARYRIDENVAAGTAFAGDELAYLFTAILSLVIGVVLTLIAWRGRQIWLVSGSVGLVFASIAFTIWLVGW